MAAVRTADNRTVLNTRFIERFEASEETYPNGRIREDAAGNRRWTITAYAIGDGHVERAHVIENRLTEAQARDVLADLSELL